MVASLALSENKIIITSISMLFGFLCSIPSFSTGGQVDLISSGVGVVLIGVLLSSLQS